MFEFASMAMWRLRVAMRTPTKDADVEQPGAAHLWREEVRATADAMSRSHGYKAAAAYCKSSAARKGARDDPEVLLLAARFEWVAQDHTSAARLAHLAMAAGGDPVACLDLACTASASAADWDVCAIAAERLATEHPQHPSGYRWLAHVCESRGDNEAAEKFALAALRRDPDDLTMTALVGRAHTAIVFAARPEPAAQQQAEPAARKTHVLKLVPSHPRVA